MIKVPKLQLPTIKLKKPQINYKKLAIRLSIISVLLFFVSGYIAYNKLYLTNERRFWSAIDNSLATSSVVRSVESGGTGNKTVETTRFNFGTEATINRITSVGTKNATSESNVTTQNILTPTAQYVRYENIFTSEKKASGGDYDFSSIKGVWAKQAEATSPEEADQLKLSYVQPQVTLAPFGNLRAVDRRQIVKELKDSNVYEIDYTKTLRTVIDDKQFIMLPAKVKLKSYVTVLQKHFDFMGFGMFPPLNADNYPDKARYSVQFLVNPSNNTIAGIKLDSQTENYSNYGVNAKAPIPNDAIPLDELQQKLQSLQ
ncbi:hypothetical protein EB118_08665 [bacterium]|nr:hypothetical protein [bacterium]NBX98594.1 hypothetical protein [bacterium]NDC94687.1 hypothetical protein [bacterium]NDD84217.1 hypothetical protein [bacterium]NDG30134.1 hypothetical protein [bacterium]